MTVILSRGQNLPEVGLPGRGVVEAVTDVDNSASRVARNVSEGEPEGLSENVARHSGQENVLPQIHSASKGQEVEGCAQHVLAAAVGRAP